MIDSFKYLPRVIAALYSMTEREPEHPVPWTPLAKPLADARFALITTGGHYLDGEQRPFDMAREKAEPTWGDPTFRAIPSDTSQDSLAASHLHINTEYVLEDVNVLLPLNRFQELVAAGKVGSLAPTAYSFMGFQGFPPDTDVWVNEAVPQVVAQLQQEQVDCVLLTPA